MLKPHNPSHYQSHTFLGKRGEAAVLGIKMSDLYKLFIERAEHLHGNSDCEAAAQEFCCEVEKLMGNFPNVDLVKKSMGPRIQIAYTNHRGERALRDITIMELHFGSTSWHPEPQWLIKAWDHSKGAFRDFAVKGFEDVTVKREHVEGEKP